MDNTCTNNQATKNTITKYNTQVTPSAASAGLLAHQPAPPKKKVRLRGRQTHRTSKGYDDSRLGPALVYDPSDNVGRFHPQYELLVEACAFYLQVRLELCLSSG